MDDRVYAHLPPNIGLNSQQIHDYSEQGRARIAAENAVKEAERKQKQEERMRHKGWKGKTEFVKAMMRSAMGKKEKEKGQGGEIIR